MYWNYNKHSRKERRMLLVAECVKEKKTQEEIAEELGVEAYQLLKPKD